MFRKCLVSLLCVCLVLSSAPHMRKVEALDARDLIYAAAAWSALRSNLLNLERNGQGYFAQQSAIKQGVSEDQRASEIVAAAKERLVVAAVRAGDSVETPFRVQVSALRGFDAARWPGNFIAISEGLIKTLGYNEDEVAFVVAHEIGHGTGRHLIKSIDKIVGLQVAVSLYLARNNADYLGGLLIPALASNIRAKGMTLPNEWDADGRAFRYAAAAGYNPGAGAAAFVRARAALGEYVPNGLGGFFQPSDHPTWGERIAKYNEQIHEYSNKRVFVKNARTVMVDGQAFVTITGKSYGQLPEERAYLIAGKLARVLHDGPELGKAFVDDEGQVMIGGQDIMRPSEGEIVAEILADRLNEILRLDR